MPDPLSLNYLPTLPRRRDWRVGCAGAGFNPVATASRTVETAGA